MTELLTCTAGRTTVTNPFDGAEVGTVSDMPPEDSQTLSRIASVGARIARRPLRCAAEFREPDGWEHPQMAAGRRPNYCLRPTDARSRLATAHAAQCSVWLAAVTPLALAVSARPRLCDT